jgi:GNAT superfamily N-acetyltransferase
LTLDVIPVGPHDGVELDDYVAVRNAVTPDWPASREDVAWSSATYPGGVRFLARLDGRAVGAGNAGRMYVYPPDHPDWWLELTVLPEARGRGAGTGLLAAIVAAARDAGKQGLQGPTWEHRPEGQAFLANRGFIEHERAKAVRLDLADAPPATAVPAGIRLVTLAERPDLVVGVHRVAEETFPDIPSADEPARAGDLAEFRARDVDRPGIRLDGFQVALAGEEVIGYASVIVERARPSIGIHDMTAVRRGWRGNGVATALKLATIDWARRAGLEALETGNDVENGPMRAVNARLGYRPLPDIVFMRGPLPPPSAPR